MSIPYIVIFVFITMITFSLSQVYALPIIYDDDYVVEKFVTGLEFPTTMVFVGNDILVLEKNTGKVIRIQDNGVMYNEPALDLPVLFQGEAGLLGVASVSNHIYLYFTESLSGFDKYGTTKPDGSVSHENSENGFYQYNWNGKNLDNPILIKELPLYNGSHLAGVITIGLNNEVYFVIGDQWQYTTSSGNVISYDIDTVFQNIPIDTIYETGSIFKVDTESNNSVELFATGIRNSFGLAVDPITGYLWDTENGQDVKLGFDEINLVKPGFNSGWISVMGPIDRVPDDWNILNQKSVENFVYSDPEFSWHEQVAPTAIAFPGKYGFEKYSDSLFVGDINHGRIYKFQLNTDRTGFVFSNPDLSDLVADYNDKITEIIFAEIPGGVTDIEFHNGAMYVVSIFDGSVYKIYSKELEEEKKIWNVGMLKLLKTRTGTEYINLSNTDFRGIDFHNVNISNVNLTRANLSHADLSGQDITRTILTGADLSNANLAGVDLSGKDLTGTRLVGVDLSGKDLSHTILIGADLSNTDLSNAILTNTNLENASLENANLLNTNLDSTNLSNADLRNTILVDANLSNAILTGADLTNAVVTGAILTGANLENAVLTNTILNCGATVKDKTVYESLQCYIVFFTQTCKFWIFNFCN